MTLAKLIAVHPAVGYSFGIPDAKLLSLILIWQPGKRYKPPAQETGLILSSLGGHLTLLRCSVSFRSGNDDCLGVV